MVTLWQLIWTEPSVCAIDNMTHPQIDIGGKLQKALVFNTIQRELLSQQAKEREQEARDGIEIMDNS